MCFILCNFFHLLRTFCSKTMVWSRGVLTLPRNIKRLHLPAPQLSLEISHVGTGAMKHTSELGTDGWLKSWQLSGSSNALPFLFECPMSVDIMISTDYLFDRILIWQEIGLWARLGGMILIRLAEVERLPGLEPRVHIKKKTSWTPVIIIHSFFIEETTQPLISSSCHHDGLYSGVVLLFLQLHLLEHLITATRRLASSGSE